MENKTITQLNAAQTPTGSLKHGNTASNYYNIHPINNMIDGLLVGRGIAGIYPLNSVTTLKCSRYMLSNTPTNEMCRCPSIKGRERTHDARRIVSIYTVKLNQLEVNNE